MNDLTNCCSGGSAERAALEPEPTGKELSWGFDRYLNPACAGFSGREILVIYGHR